MCWSAGGGRLDLEAKLTHQLSSHAQLDSIVAGLQSPWGRRGEDHRLLAYSRPVHLTPKDVTLGVEPRGAHFDIGGNAADIDPELDEVVAEEAGLRLGFAGCLPCPAKHSGAAPRL